MSFASDGVEENMLIVECNALNSWKISIFNIIEKTYLILL